MDLREGQVRVRRTYKVVPSGLVKVARLFMHKGAIHDFRDGHGLAVQRPTALFTQATRCRRAGILVKVVLAVATKKRYAVKRGLIPTVRVDV